ncbi:DUF4191 domain-containing protein [Gryllotalpicola sp.]|uniref:DUF4191 domain-containing protein n=1 Tax=Gryllotalpicola sp. TaxID=1932787 RepID=UPI00262AAE0C|nr:DUF4191 domain-containing protein [Gryllotalpicola sp.]
MARTPEKEPGRIRQIWETFQVTRTYDGSLVWLMLLVFVLPVLAGAAAAVFIPGIGLLGEIIWPLVGVLFGVLLAVIVLGRRAEKSAYDRIAGQPGAVGAVLRSGLRGGWRGSEMPVAVNAKTRDAVYRAVGRGGVVLIGEGPASRTQRLLDEQRRRVQRVVPNVKVTTLAVGPDTDAVPLARIPRTLSRLKNTLTKAEVLAVDHRLASLNEGIPVPKGIDPTRVRAPRRPQ